MVVVLLLGTTGVASVVDGAAVVVGAVAAGLALLTFLRITLAGALGFTSVVLGATKGLASVVAGLTSVVAGLTSVVAGLTSVVTVIVVVGAEVVALVLVLGAAVSSAAITAHGVKPNNIPEIKMVFVKFNLFIT